MTEINKIINNFQKGVADGLFRGRENNPHRLSYYRRGYDFGISLYCDLNNLNVDEEVSNDRDK